MVSQNAIPLKLHLTCHFLYAFTKQGVDMFMKLEEQIT